MSAAPETLDEVPPELVRRIEEALDGGRNEEVRTLLGGLSAAGQADGAVQAYARPHELHLHTDPAASGLPATYEAITTRPSRLLVLGPAAYELLMDGVPGFARALMAEGAPLVRRIPGRAGWELRLVVQGGLRILGKTLQMREGCDRESPWKQAPRSIA